MSCPSKPHLKPAFCFLNMDLIPSLMIYDRDDQCGLQVRAPDLCVCVRASICTYTCVFMCVCVYYALPVIGTCCQTSQRLESLWICFHLMEERPGTAGGGMHLEVTAADESERKGAPCRLNTFVTLPYITLHYLTLHVR